MYRILLPPSRDEHADGKQVIILRLCAFFLASIMEFLTFLAAPLNGKVACAFSRFPDSMSLLLCSDMFVSEVVMLDRITLSPEEVIFFIEG